MRKGTRVTALVLAAALVLLLAGCGGGAKKAAIEAFNQERDRVAKQLEMLDAEIKKAESWLAQEGDGFDPKLRAALEKKLEEAKGLDVELPELPGSTEAIEAATQALKDLELAKLIAELRSITEAFRMSNR